MKKKDHSCPRKKVKSRLDFLKPFSVVQDDCGKLETMRKCWTLPGAQLDAMKREEFKTVRKVSYYAK
jgi:hypothetical protein